MKQLIFAAALVASACATAPTPYAPAESDRAKGYSELAIESDRYRVSYKGDDADQARSYALLRAAEITLENGADWFRIVDAYTEVDSPRSAGRSSVSVGGASGSYGSSVGVGVGINLGSFGGGGSPDAVHTLEMMIFNGEKPDDPDAYDARSVQASILGAPQP
jgi:hypothetical protein